MSPSSALPTATPLSVAGRTITVHRPDRIPGIDPARYARRPRTVRVLLENLVRHFDPAVSEADALRRLADGDATGGAEFAFYPERVLLQDFTGIPVIVDLSTLRDEAVRRGIRLERINPTVPVDLVVDHSVQVDSFGSARSLTLNLDREYERNHERYRFLRWAKGAYDRVRIVPPGNGICHQVNLEHLATVVSETTGPGGATAFPDTVIGTDSHTTMVNGVSVLGWGVGGIEAEAVMLGEPYFLARPEVVGVELTGALPDGATATDLVLTVTRRLREKGVVDKFVEFVGPGVRHLSVPDRATVSNMCPEYGATAALFPIDEATLAYLRATGRPESRVGLVEAYARAVGLWGSPEPGSLDFDERLILDLGTVVPSVSGPKNPEESVPLAGVPASFRSALTTYRSAHPTPGNGRASRRYPADDPLRPFDGTGAGAPAPAGPAPRPDPVRDGSVVIAAITSCTNTSNPSVMVGAGLIARRANELGLRVPAHVKTSLAPGSKVVTAYLEKAGLLRELGRLGFTVVGYGCTTCIGNSGPLAPEIERSIRDDDLFVAAVLSGNRNFEARIHNLVRANYLASPMLVVAYALAGRIDVDLDADPLGRAADGSPVTLRDLWPSSEEVARLVAASLSPAMFEEKYRAIEVGDAHWEGLPVPPGRAYPWEPNSTYLAGAPFLSLPPPWLPKDGILVEGARVLALLGDRVSTDHISPAGEIPTGTPAGDFLAAHGVPTSEFNTYGSRRGHHEVMIRGTFANVRLKNALAAPREGGVTVHLPSGDPMTIFAASERYRRDGVPLLVIAGKGYGQGSSRDWAAKGPRLLGVGAVIAEGYERIHRTNLVEMGVLPVEFPRGSSATSLGLTGRESYSLRLMDTSELGPGVTVEVVAQDAQGTERRFPGTVRLHSRTEVEYYRAGGVLPYVMARRFSG
ncbi:MAG TPA: aconitate hydratase AcnA [Thermoplasmata archaeon]|nr:aconitate hydratase AcnA [Thermoplasmata archaeon]